MVMKRRNFLKAIVSCPVCAALGATDWNYEDRGPAKWGGLDPAYSLCRDGKQQSPIDLRDGTEERQPRLKIDWSTAKFNVVNNGHTIQLNAEPGSSMEVDGVRSALAQFHFHAPSEHAISGKRTAMEAHFVHRRQDGRLTVLAVLLIPGAANAVLSAAMRAAPAKPNGPSAATSVDPRGLLPASTAKAWHYQGSLTTPPCSEDVAWIILAETVPVAQADIDRFHAVLPANARPLQPLNGRKLDRP